MANFYGFARSNYFRVKDVEKFRQAFEKIDVEVIDLDPAVRGSHLHDGREGGMVGLLGRDADGAGWPSGEYDDNDEYMDISIPDLVADHLEDGEVAVFMEAGAEKLRYISGYAVAINNKGERRQLHLDDIYKLAEDLGPNITQAVY